ncbi:DUF4349 domain-containing protein [Fulvivirga ligni]|uniref:DUF4349 domain-containing protein n=1 Tax=Fulvivirga ligni TaxID=2904246 RepID=UPI001F2DA920|nr:DUF4349 domain-containing protein [Fulvivirga ligni]UII20282.1 DUF4349 domain-containing protein [Fulvivirga ligni]
MMRNLSLLILAIVAMFSVACHQASEEMKLEVADKMLDLPAERVYESAASADKNASAAAKQSTTMSKKVVKTGDLAFESKNVEKDYEKIRQLLPKYQAYIEKENQYKSPHRIDIDLIIRVPVNGFDTTFTTISDLAYRLDNRSSNAEDVTERYYDLQARIKNKQALEDRYVQLLNKADDIKDILAIESNLNEVRTDIERLQGQFNYLSKQIGYSTINVSFYEVLPYTYDTSSRKGFGARLLSAMDGGWQGFLSFLVGIATLWPFLIFLIVLIWGLRWWSKRRRVLKAKDKSPE